MRNLNVGDTVLLTTDNWFFAPDGRQYRAVFGTVYGIFNDHEVLGIKTNARSTNWYVGIGNMIVAGCQIHYAVKTDTCSFEKIDRPDNESVDCCIYNADA